MSDDVQLNPALQDLAPILGHWRSSGVVRGDDSGDDTRIEGTDTYTALPGGQWIAHDVDVRMGEDHVVAHELIGGAHPDGGWWMVAFDGAEGADAPSRMRLSLEEPGLLLLSGDGVRSWFRFEAGDGFMTTAWERQVDDGWEPWMDMRFDA